MLIQPDTYVRLIKNCPLDKTYDHTIYFETPKKQEDYFKIELQGIPFTKQSYQRHDNGVLHIQEKAENLYDCNYLMFQNTAFGNKWFYAFVTSVEYVNNVSSKVYYEIDVMQTWFFNYELGHCYVDREHSENDVVGENTVPEGLETGEYVSSTFETPTYEDGRPIMSGKSVVVAATFNKEGKNVGGTAYGGIFSGLAFNVFPASNDGMEEAANFILKNSVKADGIVAVFMMPTAFVTGMLESTPSYDFTKTKNTNPYGFDFHNNKLLTYPYNFMYVSNLQGQSAVFPYEYFGGDKCEFVLAGDMSCNPTVVLAPRNYKGVVVNYDEKMVLTGFPQCAYATDTFRAWLAQNASSLVTSAIGLGNKAAIGQGQYLNNLAGVQANACLTAAQANVAYQGVTLGAQALGLSLATSVLSTCGSIITHSMMPDQAHMGAGSTSMAALGLLQFAFMQKHIRDEYAKIIDGYFDMFGYATHLVKQPNISSRPHWNYIKTVGCVLTGSIPADDTAKICAIYDRGITFWKKGSEVGDYSLDNRPT